MKFRLFLLVLPFVLEICFSNKAMAQELPITAQVNIGGQIIDLEVAKTPEQMEKGLMFRRNLPNNRGMLFIFQYSMIPRFWMKNTLIPLDMVFLLKNKVQTVLAKVPPCTNDPCKTYSPGLLVDRVIEMPAGRAKDLAIKKGDLVYIHFLEAAQKK